MRGPSATMRPVNTISLREASARYTIPLSTLAGWVDRGMIGVARQPERRGQAMLVYEPHVALLAKQYVPGRSRWNLPTLAS